jgi:DNA-directed RNA polymerase specialized sigma24 family protein
MNTAEARVAERAGGVQILPLTRRNRKGEVYERTVETTAQIVSALGLDKRELRERLSVTDYESHLYLGAECLVFLIRRFHAASDTEMVQLLAGGLVNRCKGRIRKVLARVDDPDARKEAEAEVIGHIFRKILDVESDAADFLQVRFWFALDRLTFKARKRAFAELNRTEHTLRLSELAGEDGEEDEDAPVRGAHAQEPSDPSTDADREVMIREALEALKSMRPHFAEAWMMRHVYGMQVEDQDENVPTISRHFDTTPRTIRNWLDRAEEALERWRERNT